MDEVATLQIGTKVETPDSCYINCAKIGFIVEIGTARNEGRIRVSWVYRRYLDGTPVMLNSTTRTWVAAKRLTVVA